MRVRVTTIFLLLPVLVLFAACTHSVRDEGSYGEVPPPATHEAEILSSLRRFEYTQVHMGVQARLILYASDSSTAERAARAAFNRIAELDLVMSDYREDSELAQLSRRSGTGPVSVSNDLFTVLSTAQRLARQSDGAFDVTVGPLVELWRAARRQRRLPDPDSLAAAQRRSGWTMLQLNRAERTAELTTPGMKLDLGGIAKGFAADEALAALKREGIPNALIEFGGDIVVGDPPPGRPGWRVTAALADPEKRELFLSNQAVSTSGDTQQFVVIDGVRYSHVVDPHSGLGLTNRTAATVIAPEGILSDGLATALTVMNPDRGRVMIEREYPHVEAQIRRLLYGEESIRAR